MATCVLLSRYQVALVGGITGNAAPAAAFEPARHNKPPNAVLADSAGASNEVDIQPQGGP